MKIGTGTKVTIGIIGIIAAGIIGFLISTHQPDELKQAKISSPQQRSKPALVLPRRLQTRPLVSIPTNKSQRTRMKKRDGKL